MCCALLVLVFLGPRIFNIFWWIFQPARWQLAFSNFLGGGNLWWIWPVLGIIFLPWTTLMYIIVAPGVSSAGSGSGSASCWFLTSCHTPAASRASAFPATKGPNNSIKKLVWERHLPGLMAISSTVLSGARRADVS